jgi:hypothetical protein
MTVVAAFYSLPPRVLPSIQAVEGGRVGQVHPNQNGSADYGVMQVNSLWVAPISKTTNLPQDEVRRRLIDDPCFNIAAAGLILQGYLVETDGNLLAAIELYHSHSPELSRPYLARVIGAARILFQTKPSKQVR